MIQRFQIEDLILQDPSGVVFRALDADTGKTVAVRRFFPFGADGGGLDPEEQIAYNSAVNRLAGVSHPALRSIICGGCDPVDGIPFIATEWVEGKSLKHLIEQGPLSAEAAATLLTQALEVCELLSNVLAEEAVWVETDPQTIIIGSEASGRPVTFWISPLKWLGGMNRSRGLESIVTLTEDVMDWKNRIVSDQAGRGLGGWFRRLDNTSTLQEARKSLAAAIRTHRPAPNAPLVHKLSPRPIRGFSSKTPLLVALILGLIVCAVSAGWFLGRNSTPAIPAAATPAAATPAAATPASASPAPPIPASATRAAATPAPASRPGGASRASLIDQRAAELSALATQADQKTEITIAAQEAAAARRGGAILWSDHDLLARKNRMSVMVEGVVENIDRSGSGKTVYVLFSNKQDRNAIRAAMKISDAAPDSIIEKLRPFIGKTVRVSGTIVLRKSFGLNRPEIVIDSPSAVRVVQ